jgi:hypothetical protein
MPTIDQKLSSVELFKGKDLEIKPTVNRTHDAVLQKANHGNDGTTGTADIDKKFGGSYWDDFTPQ